MDMFVVGGGARLCGTVRISGAKNAALPIMAAVLASDGPTVLKSVPDLDDVRTLSRLLASLGVSVERRGDGAMALQVLDHRASVADYELVRRMRASVCVLGPLLARRGRACVSLPGGCNIGHRPIDLHLKGLQALGAQIRIERGYVIAEAKRLVGNRIFLGGPFGSTVTGTANVMIAATLAEGITTIEAAACEPEIVDLGNFLNSSGAKISGLGTPFLQIEGVRSLSGTEHEIIPDRIEAGTLMMAAAATRSPVTLQNVCVEHMTSVIEKLREIGVVIERLTENREGESPAVPQTPEKNGSTAHSGNASCRAVLWSERSDVRVEVPGALQPADCIALPYPGLPTDLQAQFMALLTRARGISVITDKVFPDRFMHAPELVRMGARIRVERGTAVISGIDRLSGACVMASDLRASAALVLAALAADGESVVRRIYHLDRGYAQLERKLGRLGAEITRVKDKPANLPVSLRIGDEAAPEATGSRMVLPRPKFLSRLLRRSWRRSHQ